LHNNHKHSSIFIGLKFIITTLLPGLFTGKMVFGGSYAQNSSQDAANDLRI
jgi:hypothetical protein